MSARPGSPEWLEARVRAAKQAAAGWAEVAESTAAVLSAIAPFAPPAVRRMVARIFEAEAAYAAAVESEATGSALKSAERTLVQAWAAHAAAMQCVCARDLLAVLDSGRARSSDL